MKIIIFADKSYNFIRPLADGLHHTLIEMGHDSQIWYDGIYWLQQEKLWRVFLKDLYRILMNLYHLEYLYILRFWNLFTFFNSRRKKALKDCDFVVVVKNCPAIFSVHERMDYIRKTFEKPVVNYDFHYMPNQAWWGRILKRPRHRGLEQFDWYLPVGLVTEFAIPTEIPQIYNCIGMDVNSIELQPDQKDFLVLFDFPRKGHEQQRSNEKELLESEGINYIELKGRYTRKKIRSIYRRTSVYIVSSRESFGLPIIELQLCGAKVLVPHKEWVPAHYLDKSPFKNGIGNLGSNFLVYRNNDELISILNQLRKSINYEQNILSFRREYPFYNYINKKELEAFLNKIKDGQINANSHLEYEQYNKYISSTQDYELSDII